MPRSIPPWAGRVAGLTVPSRQCAEPIIDPHQHFWDWAARAQPWLQSAAALAPLASHVCVRRPRAPAEAAGITPTIVVQTVTEPGETPELPEA